MFSSVLIAATLVFGAPLDRRTFGHGGSNSMQSIQSMQTSNNNNNNNNNNIAAMLGALGYGGGGGASSSAAAAGGGGMPYMPQQSCMPMMGGYPM
ncbi:hypothetical protein DSO57_1013342 [Entomophthora muscae]|uniref:Uncharacterized protein n=1 Tax=Entomophthora muscae TaxID=34485 RepID=A0ACC2URE4_9FUNG|nr:hypothetical protein DSO57_1013342 [Entomophthora muscae]